MPGARITMGISGPPEALTCTSPAAALQTPAVGRLIDDLLDEARRELGPIPESEKNRFRSDIWTTACRACGHDPSSPDDLVALAARLRRLRLSPSSRGVAARLCLLATGFTRRLRKRMASSLHAVAGAVHEVAERVLGAGAVPFDAFLDQIVTTAWLRAAPSGAAAEEAALNLARDSLGELVAGPAKGCALLYAAVGFFHASEPCTRYLLSACDGPDVSRLLAPRRTKEQEDDGAQEFDDEDDIAQEFLVRMAFYVVRRLGIVADPVRCARRVRRRVRLDAWGRGSRRKLRYLDEPGDDRVSEKSEGQDPATTVERKDLARFALEHLADLDRVILRLHEIDGLSYDAVADELRSHGVETNAEAVGRRGRRAVAKLRTWLSDKTRGA